jgi:hypothetical protein
MLIAAIVVECAVAIIAILSALKGRSHLLRLRFRLCLFLLASISALIAVWGLYKEKP